MESLVMYTTKSRQFQNSQNPRRNYHSLYYDFCNMKSHVRADCNKLKKCDNCHSTGHTISKERRRLMLLVEEEHNCKRIKTM
ncbi:hypothetical protein H5410_062201 [Solanum commersonii]|uniref:Uncharacterized protein n=1 Tax=Solanum commersonii TaxID=4109 RepID=A0A9J5W9S0_SOLCO|nr:hypothetical protein H5410_062201 [Solanum commersonii]